MERIFGDNSGYSEETQNALKQVMLVSEQERTDISIYGKTGMGKAEGIVVDAWFTGFAEGAKGKVYFCVRLGRTDGMNVSSPRAKEIAMTPYSWSLRCAAPTGRRALRRRRRQPSRRLQRSATQTPWQKKELPGSAYTHTALRLKGRPF